MKVVDGVGIMSVALIAEKEPSKSELTVRSLKGLVSEANVAWLLGS